ncbi:MAG: SDR family oxidoreductase [Anaerolineae bacterium]|nr:SDR family oxidoreductase [Anaerolineae bacterium]
MKNKTILITGASDGIGKQSALRLAGMGAHIVMVGRSRSKTLAALDQIQVLHPHAKLDYLLADLSVQSEVRKLAEEFKSKFERLDVLMNNAGAIFLTRKESVDGIEMTLALNHLNYFLLTKLLLDVLKASGKARIVNVSSGAHYRGQMNFEDLEWRKGYKGLAVYSQSKLANVMFTHALARRLEGTQITANSLHPGFVRSSFTLNNGWGMRLISPLVFRKAITVEEGAETQVYLASSPEVEGVSGKFFYRSKEKTPSDLSLIIDDQERLWETSEKMTRLPEEQ